MITRTDLEIERFKRVAVPWPDGRGVYDPVLLESEHGRAVYEWLTRDGQQKKSAGWRPYGIPMESKP